MRPARANQRIRMTIVCLALTSLPAIAHGTVKFALAYGASCNLCHVTPLGGSMRNAYGLEEVILGDLPRAGRRASRARGLNARSNSFLRWGVDVRTQAFWYDTTSVRTEPLSGIFPMQATAYMNAFAGEALDFYLAHFLLQAETEFWVRLTNKTGMAYARMGRFRPAYGLNLDDHTSYIRGGNPSRLLVPGIPFRQQSFPFGPFYHGDGTVEAGLYFGDIFLTAHVANPSMIPKFSPTARDAQLGLRMEVIRSLGGLTIMAGGSYLRERKPIFRGLFTGLNWGRVTLLSEVDWVDNWAGPGITSAVAYAELDVLIRQGWRLFLKWDVHEGSTGPPQTEKDKLSRITLGGEFFPMPFLELKPQIRFDSDTYTGGETVNLLLQLHFFY